jgi:hypothetical protein
VARQFTPGGFVRSPATGKPDPGSTANAVLALAAAGLGGVQASAGMTWLVGHFGSYVAGASGDDPGRLATLILAVRSTGGDPNHFGGTTPHDNLVARLTATRQASGPDAGLFGTADPTFDGAYRQGLALMALASVGIIDGAGLAWLSRQQCDGGGWTAYRADPTTPCPTPDPATFTGPDTNSTALAVEAMQANGEAFPHDPLAYFDSAQGDDGGFAFIGAASQESDADSTAVVIQALLALGKLGSPRFTTPSGHTPMTALLSLQVGCSGAVADRGAFAFQPQGGVNVPDLLATLQAVPAVARAPFPLAPQTLSDQTPRLRCP